MFANRPAAVLGKVEELKVASISPGSRKTSPPVVGTMTSESARSLIKTRRGEQYNIRRQ